METVLEPLPAPANLLSAMANPKRLQILCLLAEHEMPVGLLVRKIGLSQSAISQHLSRLRQEKIVNTRREAQTIYYSIRSDLVNQILQTLDDFYGEPWRAGIRHNWHDTPPSRL
ncbi:helix-turn-helix transcriptional regulator [Martelella mediterranea]|uniref:ArsR/SmtB family transcription factor n=1 Tax=uncultured Martelella sp. TaxID=392331 RepID=UPI000D060669|nr:metalloregulator ArsR/SmtB family transcription factor [uncultured Martelella sp.]